MGAESLAFKFVGHGESVEGFEDVERFELFKFFAQGVVGCFAMFSKAFGRGHLGKKKTENGFAVVAWTRWRK